jgi:hypothetical protein
MEEEADSVTAQVLEEIGLDMMGKMINAPTRAGAAQVKQVRGFRVSGLGTDAAQVKQGRGFGVWGLGFGV